MGLQRYREKRDFSVTPEPKGGGRSATGFSYVIQKHAARHLHYDFRLELDGVLLSWAVPKGPSLDPKIRRLAMQTEDHPIEYGDFEGTIPAGEYGGGTVMVWDHGTWEPLDDPRKGYAKGHLRFALHGKKLRGAWHLVRSGRASDKKQGWLLFKSHDEEARTDGSIVDEQQNSAQTGRTMEQIARAADKVWHSNREPKSKEADKKAIRAVGHGRTHEKVIGHGQPHEKVIGHGRPHDKVPPRRDPALDELSKRGTLAPLPAALEPQRPALAKQVPTGSEWAHELQYDGHRILARVENGVAMLLRPDGDDWTDKAPSLAAALTKLPLATALFDGAIAVLRPDGTTDAQLLERALHDGDSRDIKLFLFDLLYLNGRDLRSLPLKERKAILESALARNTDRALQFSRHLTGSGDEFFRAACKLHAPGVVSKRLDLPYRAGKARDWLMTRCAGRDVATEAPKKKKTTTKKKEKAPITHKDKTAPQPRQDPSPNPKTSTSPAAIRLTHPERVLYPGEGITKQELAEYYAAVSPWMVPHVANRPLTLVRCPQGIGKQTFFQKHAKPPLPHAIRAIPIEDDGAMAKYMAVDDQAGLLSLVQMSVLEIHTWGAHADDPEKPDFLVFDLDPDPAVKWEAVIACAQLVRQGLARIDLESYVKTTGGKGLHVCVPIVRRVSWDEAKEFCRAFTDLIVRLNPGAYIGTMSKAQRKGKIFIDFFRNGRGATFIAPYSTRARERAPVAVPLAWDELSPKLRADHFTIRNIMPRMARLSADPWKDASAKKQVLSAAAIRAVHSSSNSGKAVPK